MSRCLATQWPVRARSAIAVLPNHLKERTSAVNPRTLVAAGLVGSPRNRLRGGLCLVERHVQRHLSDHGGNCEAGRSARLERRAWNVAV